MERRGSSVGEHDRPEDHDPAACYDCGLAYGDTGWIEAIVPDKIWARIRPEGSSLVGGILCITCIARRLKRLGFDAVPVWLCGMEPIRAMPGDPADTLPVLREWDREPVDEPTRRQRGRRQ